MLYADDALGGVDIASWAYQDDGHYSCRMSEIRTDSVREEDRGHAPVVRFRHSIEPPRVEAAGQRYKQTTEFVYLSGAISESPDLDTEIKHRIYAAWVRVRRYRSQLYDRRTVRLSLKITLFKAEVVEAMLCGCATWTMCSQNFSSLRTAHLKLFLRVIGFRRKDRTGYKPLSYGEALEKTISERIKTTIWKRQLGFAGALIRQGDSRLSKRVMFGQLAVQGPKRGGQPVAS